MTSLLRPALVVFACLTTITGVLYPLAIFGIAQTAFPHQANGSLIASNGAADFSGSSAVGSRLIGQDFSGVPKYFWGRPSATAPVPYTAFNAEKATGSSGSNLGPTNPALVDNVKARIESLRIADAAAGYERAAGQLVPVDLVTASGSGLDPHISIAAAEYQLPRVAKARAMTDDQVRVLVRSHTQPRQLGMLGEPVVNVLELNLALEGASR